MTSAIDLLPTLAKLAGIDLKTEKPIDDPQSWGIDGPAVRLGMRLIKGMSQAQVGGIERAREDRAFASVADLAHRSGAARATLARLAAADAMRSMGLSRREALWQVLALRDEPPMLEGCQPDERDPNLPKPSLHDTVVADYETLGLSLTAHPISLIREELNGLRVCTSKELRDARHGTRMSVGGLVLIRQRPSTALGIVFCTLEDETGTANLVIRPNIYEKYRAAAYGASALITEGRVERRGKVVHLNVTRIMDMSARLKDLRSRSRDFH